MKAFTKQIESDIRSVISKSLIVGRALGLILLALGFSLSFAETREWTSKDGKVLTAEFVGMQGATIKLKLTGGKVINYPVFKLSDADIVFLKSKGLQWASSEGRFDWPLVSGATIKGNLLSFDGVQVILALPEGKQASYSLKDFSTPAQQDILRSGGLPGRASVFPEVRLAPLGGGDGLLTAPLPGYQYLVLEGPLRMPPNLSVEKIDFWTLGSPDEIDDSSVIHYGSRSLADFQVDMQKKEIPKFDEYSRDLILVSSQSRSPFSDWVFCFQIKKEVKITRFLVIVEGVSTEGYFSEYRVCDLRPDNIFGHRRQWTNSQGKIISADLLAIEGHGVRFGLEGGNQVIYPLNQLSKNDVDWLSSISAPRN